MITSKNSEIQNGTARYHPGSTFFASDKKSKEPKKEIMLINSTRTDSLLPGSKWNILDIIATASIKITDINAIAIFILIKSPL